MFKVIKRGRQFDIVECKWDGERFSAVRIVEGGFFRRESAERAARELRQEEAEHAAHEAGWDPNP